jgi:hypothetical protein
MIIRNKENTCALFLDELKISLNRFETHIVLMVLNVEIMSLKLEIKLDK